MSVIWSGVTEEGAVVPVQVTAEGKVVAVGDGPEGDYLKLTGGNLTGDLTLGTDKITLNATDGSAEFAGTVTSGDVVDSSSTWTGIGVTIYDAGVIYAGRSGSGNLWAGRQSGTAINTSSISADGSATFAGQIDAVRGVFTDAPGNLALRTVDSSTNKQNFGASSSGVLIGDDISTNAGNKISLNADGSATFAGDVIIGSRGTKWLIRESNGVAMLIEQTLRGQIEPRMQKVRDLPNELDLIEAALNEIMEKLRMTPPAGWPVWDGQDGVTSDNDNA